MSEKYSYLIHDMHEYGISIKDRNIYLGGESQYIAGTGVDETAQPGVEFLMADKFIKNLHILESLSTDPICIHMSTCGGHWFEGLMIFDAIKASKNYITIINYKEARSMSSMIYLAADKRVMMPHGQFMFHTGTIATDGTGTQFETEYKEHMKLMESMLNIYIDHLYLRPEWVNKSKLQIKNWLKRKMKESEDVYFTAQESLELGFCDEIKKVYEDS